VDVELDAVDAQAKRVPKPREPVLRPQKLCGRRRGAGIIVAVTIDGDAAWPETPARMI
jgi:hypothetical protein